MAEGTYEYECMRAELLGIAKPDQEVFERARALRLQQEQQEQEVAEAELLETQEEQLTGAGGKMDELNSILSSTQQRLNRFKQSACGSFSSIFGRASIDIVDVGEPQGDGEAPCSSSGGASTSAAASGVRPTASGARADIQRRATSQLDTLDSLINKANHAEMSMAEQTKQMRRMAK